MLALAGAISAHAASFSLDAVTDVYQNNQGAFAVNGSFSFDAGETSAFWNTVAYPFLDTGFSAGFNDNVQIDTNFQNALANGQNYSGAILHFDNGSGNTGYAGGAMPLGLYASNQFQGAPPEFANSSFMGVTVYDSTGAQTAVYSGYAIRENPAATPEPASLLALAAGAGVLLRRRRR